MPTLLADPLTEIARLVQARHGVDFGRYKARCLLRRIRVRMRAVGAADLEAYAHLLGSDSGELDRLFQALTINFSSFFRDPGLFSVLRERVLLELARSFPAGPLRIWSAGCAAGEELYSLGILAYEALTPADRQRLALLGTDVDDKALEEAGAGIYPRSRLASLDISLIGKYFQPGAAGGGLRVIEPLRRRAEFQKADLLGPAPYRRVALVCCRNVLIYLEPKHQEEALARLASVLDPGGVLALGRVERLFGEARCWFETVDAAERVYRRRASGDNR